MEKGGFCLSPRPRVIQAPPHTLGLIYHSSSNTFSLSHSLLWVFAKTHAKKLKKEKVRELKFVLTE